MANPFLGLLATDDLVSNENPQFWRNKILLEFPDGMTPLTALTAMVPSEPTPLSTFNWWTEQFSGEGGAVTGIYIETTLTTAYDYATHQAIYGIDGGTVYVNCAEAVVAEFVEGTTVLLRDTDQPDVDVMGEITSIIRNGASSYVAVKLIEADDNHSSAATYNLATVDYIWAIAPANAQGGASPDALRRPPTQYSNHTQIHWDTLEMTNTLLAESPALRTGNAYQNYKRQRLQYHGVHIEKAGLFGVYKSGTGKNGKAKLYTRGMIPFIKEYASANVQNYETDTDTRFAGKSWVQAGKKWLDEAFELVSRYRSEDNMSADFMVFCGNGAMLGIQELAEAYGTINLQNIETEFGMSVTKWVTPFATFMLKTHPLLNDQTTNQYSMIIFKPENVRFRALNGRDTTYIEDPNRLTPGAGFYGVDGIKEGWICEGGWEHHHPRQFMLLHGVGKANVA